MTTPTHEKVFAEDDKLKLPLAFIFRRLHSLLGLWLVVYLFEHLLVNSQASMFFKDDGYTFVNMVNKIHAMPYLRVIEILFLGLPFLIHGLWGIKYAITSKNNSHSTRGKSPALPQYKRNRAFTWQRITSWILLVGIILHVIQMRFLNYPEMRVEGDKTTYFIEVDNDKQLSLIAANFDAKILSEGKTVKIETPDAGTAFFLIVRNTFKSPLMVVLYSILVVGASFHAFNGLWTAFISWGITLTRRSQRRMRLVTTILMWVVMILGLMACWGPYWTYAWS